MTQEQESALKFPCEFTFKVFGHHTTEFENAVKKIMKKHVPSFSEEAMRTKESSKGKYMALSITIYAESKQQLDSIYQELSKDPDILMAL